MTYFVTVELKVADQSAKDIKETLNVDLPESKNFEYKVVKVEEKK